MATDILIGVVIVALASGFTGYGMVLALSPQNRRRLQLWWVRLTSGVDLRRCADYQKGVEAGYAAALATVRVQHGEDVRRAYEEGLRVGSGLKAATGKAAH